MALIAAPDLKLDAKECWYSSSKCSCYIIVNNKNVIDSQEVVGYTGENKKGIFTVLNYILRQEKKCNCSMPLQRQYR
jgi:ATP-dependent phosphoenolpyruvate carboxykinase